VTRRDVTRSTFLERFDFEPDRFQVEGFDAVDDGDNVLVAAPTSSGKTLVAEYAIWKAIDDGSRVFYTTPIKALSNQKFSDLVSWLGADTVGLLTGDNVIRGDAEVVVMTTEVLRNMIYAESPALEGLGCVVLDEIHFLQDSYRGPVWEEVIIQTPDDVQLIGLSATVSNALELGDWIGEVRGSCHCVVETLRPVQLQQRVLVADRVKTSLEDMHLLRDGRPNPDTGRYIHKHAHGSRQRGRRRLARPRRVETIDHLYDMDRLPAIFFIFSRKGCDEAVRQTYEAGIDFLDATQRRQVETIFEEHTRELSPEDLRALGGRGFLEGLKSGIGAHHAGLVPPFKEAVEACFIAGLLQVVYATETLALGVNMPARSVLIEQLSRFRGEGHVMLTPGDFAQLTGRAGRRGLDDMGFAYVLWSPYVEFEEMSQLAASEDFVLRSVFQPTYNMAANLVATKTEQGAVDLLQQSFAQFQSNRSVVALARRLGSKKDELTERESGYLDDYGSMHAPLVPSAGPTARGRPLDAGRTPVREVEKALAKLRPGDVINEDPRRGRTSLAVIGASQRRHAGTRLRVVTPRGKTMMLVASDFGEVPEHIGAIELPHPYEPARRDFQKHAGSLLRKFDIETGDGSATTDIDDPSDDDFNEDEATKPSRQTQLADFRRIERLRNDIDRLERRLDTVGHGLGRALRSIIEVLRELGYVEGWTLTEKGALLRRVFHDRDLLVAEVISAGTLEGLDAARMAGVVSTLTYERRGPDPAPTPWFPDALTKERAGELRAVARRLSRSQLAAGVPETPDPDTGFVASAHAWALGIDLDELMEKENITGGDLVRHMRRLVDLLRQIGDVATDPDLRLTARQAMKAIDHGVVAAATRVSDGSGLGASDVEVAVAGDARDLSP